MNLFFPLFAKHGLLNASALTTTRMPNVVKTRDSYNNFRLHIHLPWVGMHVKNEQKITSCVCRVYEDANENGYKTHSWQLPLLSSAILSSSSFPFSCYLFFSSLNLFWFSLFRDRFIRAVWRAFGVLTVFVLLLAAHVAGKSTRNATKQQQYVSFSVKKLNSEAKTSCRVWQAYYGCDKCLY